ncbi:MAG: MerR family transcriptional regulator [Coriobacteriaceae bacterium]|nr:MerR family transcriptional regulator [Coriobacteriaceae bacterium]
MYYTTKQLASLAGVSTRTLRWYDKQGLLQPSRQDNGYRSYDSSDVDRLQHILFYREMGLPLEDIHTLLRSESFDATEALYDHLAALKERRAQLDRLIVTVEETIVSKEKGTTMSDAQKFEAFKQKALRENEEKYGEEIREKYGDETVRASNTKFAGLSEEQYQQSEQVRELFEQTLKQAFEQGDCTGAQAVEAAKLHKQWLSFFWPSYSPEAHKGVTQMYVDDERFTQHYDRIAPGITVFLRDSVWAWLD